MQDRVTHRIAQAFLPLLCIALLTACLGPDPKRDSGPQPSVGTTTAPQGAHVDTTDRDFSNPMPTYSPDRDTTP